MTTFQKLIATFRQNQKYQIAVFIALLFLGWLYWFQLRPAQIKASCQKEVDKYYKETFEHNDEDKDGYASFDFVEKLRKVTNDKYQACLHRNGL